MPTRTTNVRNQYSRDGFASWGNFTQPGIAGRVSSEAKVRVNEWSSCLMLTPRGKATTMGMKEG
jgi:hypothetical protein